jgi:hypothetical protein
MPLTKVRSAPGEPLVRSSSILRSEPRINRIANQPFDFVVIHPWDPHKRSPSRGRLRLHIRNHIWFRSAPLQRWTEALCSRTLGHLPSDSITTPQPLGDLGDGCAATACGVVYCVPRWAGLQHTAMPALRLVSSGRSWLWRCPAIVAAAVIVILAGNSREPVHIMALIASNIRAVNSSPLPVVMTHDVAAAPRCSAR